MESIQAESEPIDEEEDVPWVLTFFLPVPPEFVILCFRFDWSEKKHRNKLRGQSLPLPRLREPFMRDTASLAKYNRRNRVGILLSKSLIHPSGPPWAGRAIWRISWLIPTKKVTFVRKLLPTTIFYKVGPQPGEGRGKPLDARSAAVATLGEGLCPAMDFFRLTWCSQFI